MGRPNKGQHKVPRTYLEAFTNDRGRLWVVNDALNIYSDTPRDVLTEKDYYTIRFPSGEGSLVIETEVLGGIETAFGDIYKQKISQHKPLNPTEKATMAIFIASMMERAPGRREAMRNFFSDVVDTMDRMEAVMANMTEAEKRAYSDHRPIVNDEDHIPGSVMREWANDVPNLHSSGIPDLISATSPIIFEMQWNYLVRPEGAEAFVTSDNPAVMANPSMPHAGLAQKDVEITLPLSPNLALLAGWQMNQDGFYVEARSEYVDEINRRTLRHARTVISDDRGLLEKHVDRAKKFMASKP